MNNNNQGRRVKRESKATVCGEVERSVDGKIGASLLLSWETGELPSPQVNRVQSDHTHGTKHKRQFLQDQEGEKRIIYIYGRQ